MDDFTANMLERAKMRRQKLNSHLSQAGMASRSVAMPLQENNSNIDNGVKNAPEAYHDAGGCLSSVGKSKLQQLGTLYSENSCALSSPIHKAEEKILQEVRATKPLKCKLGRLNELASTRSQWEDDLSHPDLKKTVPKKGPAPAPPSDRENQAKPPIGRLVDKPAKARAPDPPKTVQARPQAQSNPVKTVSKPPPSPVKFNKPPPSPVKISSPINAAFQKKAPSPVKISSAVAAAFQKTVPSPVKINSPKTVSPFKRTVPSPVKMNQSPRKSPKMGLSSYDRENSVLKRAAMFEAQHTSPAKMAKDPTELTLAERKALFEKNKGEALLPKVAFATPLPAKLRSPAKKEQPKPVPVSKMKEKFEINLVMTTNSNMEKLEREKDLEFLKNRWNKNKVESSPAPVPPPMPTNLTPVKLEKSPVEQIKSPEVYKDSPEALKAVQSVKKIVLSPPKRGSLYPNLSDIELESDESTPEQSMNASKNSNIYLNMSFGDILEASKNMPMTPPRNSESVVLNAMDELLDAALADVSSSDQEGPTPPKKTRTFDSGTCSTSFEYERGHREDVATTPLVHTVSFYRKQQNCLSTPGNTPMKVIKRNEVLERFDEPMDESAAVLQKIDELKVEVQKQEVKISQASNALSMCLANIEFSGSVEQVEAERLLLIAGHKRQACAHEIERLEVERTLRPKGSNADQLTEQGDLFIRNIVLPLKREALRAIAAEENNIQYFLCLVKSGECVVATPVVKASGQNIQNNSLIVPGEVRLEKLYSDFKVTIELYHIIVNKEILPHHIKYHLPGKRDNKLSTPIKKKNQSRFTMLKTESPAGPNAVRTTNFQLCGYVIFSLREIKRVQWTLSKVPYTSPLEGSISMKITTHLKMDDELRGFLSMFDDISGLGAWHRRWCLLSEHTLSFWKYPDEENKKVPLGSIDLRSVVTSKVGIVSRDICARLHTFLLETTRAREAHDTESLILVLEGETARIRHLLSADTKEERIEWCNRLNRALALIRAWNCQA